MDSAQRQAAKARLVEGMLQGQPWAEAARAAGVETSRSCAYRLTRRVCAHGDRALADGRHGHVAKMRPIVRQWLADYCRGAPETPSRGVQAALQEHFGLRVSITHLNRVRAALGLGSRRGGGGEKNHPAMRRAE